MRWSGSRIFTALLVVAGSIAACSEGSPRSDSEPTAARRTETSPSEPLHRISTESPADQPTPVVAEHTLPAPDQVPLVPLVPSEDSDPLRWQGRLPVGQGSSSSCTLSPPNVLDHVEGAFPDLALAYGGRNGLLVYGANQEQLRTQPIDATGAALGSRHDTLFPHAREIALLFPTPDAYLVVTMGANANPRTWGLHARTFDRSGAPMGDLFSDHDRLLEVHLEAWVPTEHGIVFTTNSRRGSTLDQLEVGSSGTVEHRSLGRVHVGLVGLAGTAAIATNVHELALISETELLGRTHQFAHFDWTQRNARANRNHARWMSSLPAPSAILAFEPYEQGYALLVRPGEANAVNVWFPDLHIQAPGPVYPRRVPKGRPRWVAVDSDGRFRGHLMEIDTHASLPAPFGSDLDVLLKYARTDLTLLRRDRAARPVGDEVLVASVPSSDRRGIPAAVAWNGEHLVLAYALPDHRTWSIITRTADCS